MAQWNKADQAYRAQDTTNFEVYMCADRYGNIGACGGDNQFEINVAAGITTQIANVHKYGAVVTSAATYDTVWSEGDAYQFPTTAGTVTVVSTSTQDNPTGTGVSSIVVQGLDANYNEVEESIELDGTTGVAGTVSFLRTHRAFGEWGNTNLGNITISIGSTVTCAIAANMGQSQVAFYTVPAGKSAFLKQFSATQNKNQENSVRMFQRLGDSGNRPFRLVTELNLYGSNMILPYTFPIFFPEKTDIEVRAYTGSNCTVSTTFDLYVADNDSVGI